MSKCISVYRVYRVFRVLDLTKEKSFGLQPHTEEGESKQSGVGALSLSQQLSFSHLALVLSLAVCLTVAVAAGWAVVWFSQQSKNRKQNQQEAQRENLEKTSKNKFENQTKIFFFVVISRVLSIS